MESQIDHEEIAGAVAPAASCSALFQAGCSGLWYRNAKAAGTIDAVKCERCGTKIERTDGECGLRWIHRVADWWPNHSQNESGEGRRKESAAFTDTGE